MAGSEAMEVLMAEARQVAGEFHWISNHLPDLDGPGLYACGRGRR